MERHDGVYGAAREEGRALGYYGCVIYHPRPSECFCCSPDWGDSSARDSRTSVAKPATWMVHLEMRMITQTFSLTLNPHRPG